MNTNLLIVRYIEDNTNELKEIQHKLCNLSIDQVKTICIKLLNGNDKILAFEYNTSITSTIFIRKFAQILKRPDHLSNCELIELDI